MGEEEEEEEVEGGGVVDVYVHVILGAVSISE